MIFHQSVLLEEVMNTIGPNVGEGLCIDCTTGEGGHSEEFLKRFPGLRMECWDTDLLIQKVARERLDWAADRVCFRTGWFDVLWDNVVEEPGGVLMDLGISMFHYRGSGRGFTFQTNEPLDMRLGGEGDSAADLVNSLPEHKLESMIREYGDERMAGRIAREIVENRPHSSSFDFGQIVARALPRNYEKGRIHPATRTFQALRIAVNDELGRLDRALDLAFGKIKVGGRLGVITFHSLEDRIVKNHFRQWARACVCPPEVLQCACGGHQLGKLLKEFRATEAEKKINPASRSATLRVIEKKRKTRHEN